MYPDSRHYFIATTESSQSHAWAVDNAQQIIRDLDKTQTLLQVIRRIVKALDRLGTANQIHIDSDDSDGDEASFDVEVEGRPDSFPTSVLGTKRRRPGHTPAANANASPAGDPTNIRLAACPEPYHSRPGSVPATQHVARFESSAAARKARIQEDLKAVSNAGYFFGVLEGMEGAEDHSILAVSVKISTLALSLQMLLAWDLHPDMYFVLLIRFSGGYITYEPLLELSNIEAGTSFRVGKCTKYKPSLDEALAAFGLDRPLSTVGVGTNKAGSEDETAQFSKILISSELGKLMSDSFLTIVRFYNSHGWSWADALKMVVNQPSIQSDEQQTNETSQPRGTKSLPLLAMQFAVDRLRNCTKYCQSCYTELDKNWQSLKPTVCSRELCLYQHIQIGLTQYLEYEILCQPAVIDLLINFFYVALASFTVSPFVHPAIRAFPSGLRLFVPDLGDDHMGYFSRIDDTRFTVVLSTKPAVHQFRLNQWVAISHVKNPDLRMGQLLKHAVITEVDTTGLILYLRSDTDMVGYPSVCYVFPYTRNIDTVDNYSKAWLLKDILDTLPSVDFIKSQLESPLVGNLKSVEGISPSAVVLLEWIIATNRSCIMQIANKNLMVSENRGAGYEPPAGWLQFCFFHGPPNAEAEFESELASCLAAGMVASPACPTLLAWHGSKMQNWHSILRTGLDYQEVVNGRSFGNGVYFSHEFVTSQGYAGPSMFPQWPKAVTDLDSVVSLNEIINAPLHFQSATPHYVVHKNNWSRCRFLFAKARSPVPHRWPQMQDTALSSSLSTDCGYFLEDSRRPARGPNRGTLQIPLASMPPRTSIAKAGDSSTALHMNLLKKGGQVFTGTMDAKDMAFTQAANAPLEVYIIDDCADADESSALDGDDTDVVITKVVPRTYIEISDDEDDILQPASKRIKTPAAEPKSAHVNDNVTPFVPGMLNHATLQVLQPPSWGTPAAQRALVSCMRDAQRMQASTPLPNLGWYIDFDKLENLFQWVFELHSFDNNIPLAADMKANNVNSIVMEMRFGPDYPITPPLVRVIRPRFLPFLQGGGGHVTAGGSVCMELLTGTGWLPSYELPSVLMQVHLALSTAEPPARLEMHGMLSQRDYGIVEAMAGYMRAAATHGWSVPRDMLMRGSYM